MPAIATTQRLSLVIKALIVILAFSYGILAQFMLEHKEIDREASHVVLVLLSLFFGAELVEQGALSSILPVLRKLWELKDPGLRATAVELIETAVEFEQSPQASDELRLALLRRSAIRLRSGLQAIRARRLEAETTEDWDEALYNCRYIREVKATSIFDDETFKQYWVLYPRFLELNITLANTGGRIARIFMLKDPAELRNRESYDVIKQQLDAGIRVGVAKAAEIPKDLILDFGIYYATDQKKVIVESFPDHTSRKLMARLTLTDSADPLANKWEALERRAQWFSNAGAFDQYLAAQ